MEVELTKSFISLLSSDTFLSTVIGAIVGGVISWLTARSILNNTQAYERRIRLNSLVKEMEFLSQEMFFTSYQLAGEIHKNNDSLETEDVRKSFFDLISKFWIASNSCRDIIDRHFPDMASHHEDLLNKLRIFPDVVSFKDFKQQFLSIYGLDSLDDLVKSKRAFKMALFSQVEIKEAFAVTYGIKLK